MRPFGEIAVARRMVTRADMDQALDIQRELSENGEHEHIGELLVSRQLITPQQVQQVLELQGKRMLFCPECFAHFNVRDYSEEGTYRCRKCGERLIAAESLEDSASSRSSSRIEQIEVDSQLGRPPLAGRAVLRILTGERAGAEFRVAEGETLHLGSREDSDVYLPDGGIRPLHCKVRSNGLDVTLFDYEGRGATRVNGQAVDFLRLCTGDTVDIGSIELEVRPWSQDPSPAEGEEGEPKREQLLGRALVERGLVTGEQIQLALQEQDQRRRAENPIKLGQLLVAQGLVTEHQIKSALSGLENQRLHVRCPDCGTSFNLRAEDLGSEFPCFGCGRELRVPKSPLLLRNASGGDKRKTHEVGRDLAPRPTQPVAQRDVDAALAEEERQAIARRASGAETEGEPPESEGGTGPVSEFADTAEIAPVEDAAAPRAAAPSARAGDTTRSVPLDGLAGAGELTDSSGDHTLVLELGIPIPIDEEDYCRAAFSERFATDVQLERALVQLKTRRDGGEVGISLGRLLVEQRAMTPAHHQQLLAKLGLHVTPVDIPGYQLIKKIGEGASGVVYQALRLAGRRPVALKIIRPELHYDERFVRRFYRETELAMRLNHPNVVAGVDAGQHGHHMYMAMELFVGETVEDYLGREGRMSERYALEIGYQAALALAHANSHSLIHRDVKPGNIVLDHEGVAKLIDLGLAKSVTGATAQSVTQTGLILGTPNFISPEQARGERVIDFRTDIYSLGATIYQMVTGELPFQGGSPLDTMMMHLNDDPIPPRERTEQVSRVLSKLILKMMAKAPGDRFDSWDEIVVKFETLLQR